MQSSPNSPIEQVKQMHKNKPSEQSKLTSLTKEAKQANKRCVIVGAAPIINYPKLRTYLKPDDYFVYCDGGLKHTTELAYQPNLIVGDFDSFPANKAEQYIVETISLPRAKDDTDSMYAAKEMLKRDYRNFLLIGMIGGRFDHSLANIALLLYLHQQGCQVMLVDDYAEYEIVSKQAKRITAKYPYFSLLAINGKAKGVNISGAKFPLKDAIITPNIQYAVSNEVLAEQTAEVTVEQGELLLLRLYHI